MHVTNESETPDRAPSARDAVAGLSTAGRRRERFPLHGSPRGAGHAMSHELICNWLGLPAGSWPPDHYRLLGLEPGEPDVVLIDQRARQRLDTVRGYQATHPEAAVAIARLQEALATLTDPAAKMADVPMFFSRPFRGVGTRMQVILEPVWLE